LHTDPSNHFIRIGLGRKNFDEVLEHVEAFLNAKIKKWLLFN
jgi:hypothetical protein